MSIYYTNYCYRTLAFIVGSANIVVVPRLLSIRQPSAGAVVIGLPDTSSPTWTATVRQEGLADRRLPVVRALS